MSFNAICENKICENFRIYSTHRGNIFSTSCLFGIPGTGGLQNYKTRHQLGYNKVYLGLARLISSISVRNH